MAGSLFLLLDDIASVLDDVAVLTKVAARKTAGVLGDDLALNAEQVSGIAARRELPVVWAVARGSALNKVILVPAAMAISALMPWAVAPLLVLGGAFLCYEGVEKLAHRFLHGDEEGRHAEGSPSSASDDDRHATDATGETARPPGDATVSAEERRRVANLLDADAAAAAAAHPTPDERRRIRGAIRTDFILSAEIVVITLGTVADEPFVTRLGVLIAISSLMTIGVYGLVAGIVKLDDAGLALARRPQAAARALGRGIGVAAPWLMRGLSVAGTAAMFLVGGGLLTHEIPALHHLAESIVHGLEGAVRTAALMGIDGVAGLLLGIVVVATVTAVRRGVAAFRGGGGGTSGKPLVDG